MCLQITRCIRCFVQSLLVYSIWSWLKLDLESTIYLNIKLNNLTELSQNYRFVNQIGAHWEWSLWVARLPNKYNSTECWHTIDDALWVKTFYLCCLINWTNRDATFTEIARSLIIIIDKQQLNAICYFLSTSNIIENDLAKWTILIYNSDRIASNIVSIRSSVISEHNATSYQV